MRINPYKPSSGLMPSFFAGRSQELEKIERKIKTAVEKRFALHSAIIGEWGIGKSCLLKKYKEIAEDHDGFSIPLYAYTITEPETFVKFFIENFKLALPSRLTEKVIKSLKSFGIDIFGSGFQIELEKVKGVEPQTTLQHFLKSIWENKKNIGDPKLILVCIDDIHKISEAEKILEILKNVFNWAQDQGYIYMLAVSGTEELFKIFNRVHDPLTRFIDPSLLQPLSKTESMDAIKKPLEGLGVIFKEDVISNIVELSGGNPFYIQLLCAHAFDQLEDSSIDMDKFLLSLESAISDVAVRNFDRLYDGLSKTERDILWVMLPDHLHNACVPMTKEYSAEAIQSMALEKFKIKEPTTRALLSRMLKDNVIKKNAEDKTYTIEDKLFSYYLLRKLSKPFVAAYISDIRVKPIQDSN